MLPDDGRGNPQPKGQASRMPENLQAPKTATNGHITNKARHGRADDSRGTEGPPAVRWFRRTGSGLPDRCERDSRGSEADGPGSRRQRLEPKVMTERAKEE